VGGSVAGAATAAFLGRKGRRVLVLERDRFPRDKPCGEGLMPHGVEVLDQLGVLDRVLAAGARPLTGVRYALASGESVTADFPRVDGRPACALGIRRLALDQILLDRAHETVGVCVVEGCDVRGLVRESGRVAGVTDGSRVFRAPVVVGADGLRSRVRRELGWERRRRGPRRYAVVGHFRLSEEKLAPLVDVTFAAGMEVYVTPLGGDEVLVAVLAGHGVMHGFAGDLAGSFHRTVFGVPRLAELLDRAKLLPGVRATGPFAVRAARVAGDGALLVGDAAGFLDPITGEGMASSLLQARAAARVIDAALAADRQSPDLSPFAAEHRLITQTGDRLTWIAFGLTASPRLRRRAMAGLRSRPGLFQKLLAVNCGYAGLGAVSPREWLALLTGW
jgi:flavin-dependent dehydrogenase